MSAVLKKKLLLCNFAHIRVYCTTGYDRLDRMLVKNRMVHDDFNEQLHTPKQHRARSIQVLQHYTKIPHLNKIKGSIPAKYFVPKRRLTPQHLYLADTEVAKSVVSHIMPFLSQKDQLICETNAGLGFVTSELLERGIGLIRLYEACTEFRQILKDLNHKYPNKVELFVKDIYHVASLAQLDKYDSGDRVEQVLRGVPKRSWSDDPVMTIIGPMPSLVFIKYLLKMLALQQGIVTYGRVQILALMRPVDYIKCNASPDMSLHVYQIFSVLFQLFFEYELIEKYPRKSFLPWETKSKNSWRFRPHNKVDVDYIYLVRINLKKTLPTEAKHLLHLQYFITQGFRKGKPKVIPTVEKWLPDIGINLIAPSNESKAKSFPNMNIYTECGKLTPTEILQVFLEMLQHPEYDNCPLSALVDAQLLKYETIESDLANRKTSHSESLKEI